MSAWLDWHVWANVLAIFVLKLVGEAVIRYAFRAFPSVRSDR